MSRSVCQDEHARMSALSFTTERPVQGPRGQNLSDVAVISRLALMQASLHGSCVCTCRQAAFTVAADTPDTCCKTCSAVPLRVEVLFRELFWRTGDVGRQNSGVDPWMHRGTKPARWCADAAMWARLAQSLQIETVPFGACGSYAFHATGNLDSPHCVFKFCVPVEVSMDVVVCFPAAVGQKQ